MKALLLVFVFGANEAPSKPVIIEFDSMVACQAAARQFTFQTQIGLYTYRSVARCAQK